MTETRWVKLSERKPDKKKTIDNCILYYGISCYNKPSIYYGDCKPDYATHWLELPELPKEEKPVDPDWVKLRKDYNRVHYENDDLDDLSACVNAIYIFLEAKYGK